MSKYIDPEKFASALLASYKLQSVDEDEYVEKGLELYTKALEKAESLNEIYSKK